MPRVTVCLAVYNGAASVRKAIQTVLDQTYRDFDILVLDDGSTDASPDIVQAMIDEGHPIRLIRTPNAGLGEGRRRMTLEATGEFIAFIDHDDFWLPHKLAAQVKQLDDTGAVLAHADAWYVYNDGREVPRELALSDSPWECLLPNNRIIASTVLYRRESMLEAGNFVADTVRCSDWYGWAILAKNGRFVHWPEKVVRYSVLSSSLANAGFRFFDAQRHIIENHFFPRFDELMAGVPVAEAKRYRKVLRQTLGAAYSGMARQKLRAGDSPTARRLAQKSILVGYDVLRVWSRSLGILLLGR